MTGSKAGKWASALEEFIHDLEINETRSHNTSLNYLGDLKKLAVHFCRISKGPEDITREDLEKYIADLTQNTGYKPATVARHTVSIKKFFGWREDNQLNAGNPASDLPSQKVGKNEAITLTAEEVGAFVSLLRSRSGTKEGSRNLAMVLLILDAGLNISELLGLTICDIYLDETPPKVFLTNRRLENQIVEIQPETAQSLRDYLFKKLSTSFGEPLFTSFKRRRDEPLTRQGVWLILKETCLKAGLPRITPRQLRDTSIKMRLERGESLEEVAALLGLSGEYPISVRFKTLSEKKGA